MCVVRKGGQGGQALQTVSISKGTGDGGGGRTNRRGTVGEGLSNTVGDR